MSANNFVGLKWFLIASAVMLGGNITVAQAQNKTLSVAPVSQSCGIVFGAGRDKGATAELCSVASGACGELNQETLDCYAKTLNPNARPNRSKSGSLTTSAPSSSFSASPKK
jgi:hypothetical protein